MRIILTPCPLVSIFFLLFDPMLDRVKKRTPLPEEHFIWYEIHVIFFKDISRETRYTLSKNPFRVPEFEN